MLYNPRGFIWPWVRAGLTHVTRLRTERNYRELQLQQFRLRWRHRYQPFVTNLWGVPWSGPDAASFLSAFDEIFVNDIYNFQAKSPVPNIIDCGANIGLSVLFFVLRYPQANIRAFEADPEIFGYLEKNVRMACPSAKVELNASAVFTHAMGVAFQMEGADGGRVVAGGPPRQETKTVPSIRLRDLLAEPVDFLKLDIEGAEFDVLADCADRFSSVRNCFVEMHGRPNEPSRFGEAISILEQAGFRLQIHVPFAQRRPFFEHTLSNGMDLQLNVYGCRPQNT